MAALIDLFETADFEVLFQPERMSLLPSGLLETFAPEVMKRALWREEHVFEVLHGLPAGVEPGTPPRSGHGPGTSVTSRQKAEAAELAALGHEIKSGAVGLRRRRYMEDGLVGLARLVDHRSVRKRKEFGNAPDAFVAAMRQAIKEGVETSTRNGAYLIWRTGEIIRENGGDLTELPSRRTLYRLLDRLAAGTHATGSAVARRSTAHGAAALFGELTVSAPGEFMQIDSTPLDVMVRLDDGVVGKVELTGMVDVASRTLTAAVLRPTTKSVDAGVLLARTVTPELMRPGWVDALKMYRSVLPHRRLLTIDERPEHAAAKSVIVPEMIVCDHGKVFVSHDFRASCRFLGDRLPAHAQGLAPSEEENLWSLPELQDLLDEWIVAKWQNRAHEGLRDPDHPGRLFTPNQKYAVLGEACGYVPVALSGEDYIELLPAAWRAVNSYGIRIDNRTHDAPERGPMRRRDSGITA
ncbi:integrase [Streptomyces sp. NPDC086796]|uniref:integrase n=1 Tax=unclassified Streptomyces TaxID=2593676 RepID=UPI0033939E24